MARSPLAGTGGHMMKRLPLVLSTLAAAAYTLAPYAPQAAAAGQGAAPAAQAAPPAAAPVPPVVAAHPYDVKSPNGSRNDDYYWLRDDQRKNPEMLAYLAAENAYTDAMLAHTKPEQELLFQELVGRVKQDDSTVPARKNGYWYYKRFEEGKEYPIYARRKGSPTAPEQVILDGNALAAGHSFFQIGGTEVTRDGKLLAYGEDVVGRRQYVLKFKDLETGATLADAIPGVSPSFAWANDGRTLLYVETTRSPCWATGCASTCSAPIRRAIRRCTRRRTTRSTSSCRRARATASWSSRCRARCPPSGGWRAPTIRSSPSMSSCRASATTSTRPRI